MRPDDRFRAGSIVKPFVSVVVLQLAERGRLSLDARLPDVLPASVTGRLRTRPTSRFACCSATAPASRIGTTPGRRRASSRVIRRRCGRSREFLDLAAAKPPVFAPGTSFSYSNTDYTLLGLIIERITGRSWRHEVTRRVIRPLRLTRTALPAPGQRSIKGPLAHGYGELDGKLVDLNLDPSFAGAAGGHALATTVGDLARFLDTLFAGRLFRHRATLKQMLTSPRRRARAASSATGSASSSAPYPAAPSSSATSAGRRLPLLRRPRAPVRRDDRARAERRGRPDPAGPSGGEGAHGDETVSREGPPKPRARSAAGAPTRITPPRTRVRRAGEGKWAAHAARRSRTAAFHAKRKRGDRHVRAGHSVPQVEPSATRGATDEARDVRGPQAPC